MAVILTEVVIAVKVQLARETAGQREAHYSAECSPLGLPEAEPVEHE